MIWRNSGLKKPRACQSSCFPSCQLHWSEEQRVRGEKSVRAERRRWGAKVSCLECLFSDSTSASPVWLFPPWTPSCWLSSRLSFPIQNTQAEFNIVLCKYFYILIICWHRFSCHCNTDEALHCVNIWIQCWQGKHRMAGLCNSHFDKSKIKQVSRPTDLIVLLQDKTRAVAITAVFIL